MLSRSVIALSNGSQSNATVFYYSDDDAYYSGSDPATRAPQSADKSGDLRVVECSHIAPNGDTWFTVRIDGFNSTGGHDWNQIDFPPGSIFRALITESTKTSMS